jgi:hypothetical protein
MELAPFLKTYSPTLAKPVTQEILDKYKDKVPASLLELWQKHGFGKYNDGLLELINPDEYQQTLETWLGKKIPQYLPIAITAFGDLFYYRKLTPDDEDICLLETHYRNISTCTWNLNDFFNEYLLEEDILSDILRNDLFQQSLKKCGPLEIGEMYCFVPALAIGGAEEVEYVEKGNARVHMDLLFQMTA